MSIQWNEITWYSKGAALLIFIALSFVGFYLGIRYQKLYDEANVVPQSISIPPTVASSYLTSNFRVLRILKNPFAPDYLIVATERGKITCDDSGRCIRDNDTGCGSVYTSPTCYFFLEPDYVYGADLKTKFLGRWKGSLDGFSDETKLIFKSSSTVEFESFGGDAGVAVQSLWSLNLKTGEMKEVNSTTTESF